MAKYRVHWIREIHMTAEVDIEWVSERQAEAWLLEGHPKPRDRMEVAEAQEFLTGLDAVFEAGMLGVPVMTVLEGDTVMQLTEVRDEQ